MILTTAHILDLIEELPINVAFDYVSGGDSKAKLVSIDRENVKVDIVRINADGSEKNASMTTDILNILANSIKENKPFKFDNVLNGSGNVRSTMEAIFAHTSEFYSCKIGRVKHLIWVPRIPHEIGKIIDYDSIKDKMSIILSNDSIVLNQPLQQIFYGAPGTGKSHEIKEMTKGESVIRTTFHPDSDYSTFVGAYKPVMDDVEIRIVPVVVNNGISLNQNQGTYKEKRITYKFVKQAFLKAYLAAWKKYADGKYNNSPITPKSFNIPGIGYYRITSVESDYIVLSRKFVFPKNLVSNEWQNLWKNGSFDVPFGAQPGKTVQHAIAIWIYKHIPQCTIDSFEEGWKKLISTIEVSGFVEVSKKKQTYFLAKINDTDDILDVTVEESRNNRKTLQSIYEGKESSRRLFNKLVSILKEYDPTSFDKAWDRLKDDAKVAGERFPIDAIDDEIAPQYLIIEEINRGNCAQIFGDLFQLLDRTDGGFSTYPIEADTDIQIAIKTAFDDEDEYKIDFLNIDDAVEDYTSNYDSTLSEDVKAGRVLLLPPNLYIWATMNTSDQSLFPIDSAFKRRWDWKYMKIRKGRDENGNELDWKIVVKDKDKNIVKIYNEDSLSWWDFIEKINEIIASMTSSADKQLGYFFCKADEKVNEADRDCTIISANTFVGKVLFYLWNDVFKDYGFEDASLFRYKEIKDGKETEKDLTFPDFYDEDGENVNTVRVVDFVQKVMNWKKTSEENN